LASRASTVQKWTIAGSVKLQVEEAANGFTIRPIDAFNRRTGVARYVLTIIPEPCAAELGHKRVGYLVEQPLTKAEDWMSTGVVLLGGTHGALSAARSFGRKRIRVVLVTDDHPLPKLSRHVQQSFVWPGALSPEASEWLAAFGAEHGFQNWLLIPCADAEVRCVAQNLVRLRTVFKVVSTGWSDLQKVCDKQLLATTAAAAGVSFPKNYRIRSADDCARIDVQFPVVLKPAMRLERNAFTSSKAWRADSRDELVRLYHEAALLVGDDEVVVQELIPGGGETQFSYAALWHANAPVAEMSARRMRQYPIEFGHTSTFVEVVDNDAVKVAARKLLSSIGFEGLVEVEFKFDVRDRSYKVLDVNPRTWSWLSLCSDSGLDLALLMRNVTLGKPVDPAAAQAGHAWVHLSKDIIVGALLFFRRELSIGAYLKSLRQKLTFAAFAWDDPLPGILELPLFAHRIVHRALLGKREGAHRSPRASSEIN
jgi:predicted ATP-grasp superfamily ATP-dependent carboligase